MLCEGFWSRYDGMEPGAPLSPLLRRHLRSCPACRMELRRFEEALALWRREEVFGPEAEETDRLEELVMGAVRLTPRPRRELSLLQWLAPGLLVALSCLFLPLLARLQGVGDAVLLPLALVFGIGLSVFALLFVGSHAVELKAEFDRRRAAFAGAR